MTSASIDSSVQNLVKLTAENEKAKQHFDADRDRIRSKWNELQKEFEAAIAVAIEQMQKETSHLKHGTSNDGGFLYYFNSELRYTFSKTNLVLVLSFRDTPDGEYENEVFWARQKEIQPTGNTQNNTIVWTPELNSINEMKDTKALALGALATLISSVSFPK